jgi:hypothetical protein
MLTQCVCRLLISVVLHQMYTWRAHSVASFTVLATVLATRTSSTMCHKTSNTLKQSQYIKFKSHLCGQQVAGNSSVGCKQRRQKDTHIPDVDGDVQSL